LLVTARPRLWHYNSLTPINDLDKRTDTQTRIQSQISISVFRRFKKPCT